MSCPSRAPGRWSRARRAAALVVVAGAVAASAGASRSRAAYTASTANGANSLVTAAAFDYATLVGAASPWLWWRLGDTSGTTTADASGNGRTATLSTVGIARGASGAILQDASTAFGFDGTAGCLAASATHANPTTLSIEAWFRTTTSAGGLLVGFEGTSAAASGLPTTYDRQVFLTAAGNVAFGAKTSGPVTVTSPAAYNDGAWHHVVATLGAGGQKLYVDGLLVGTNANTTAATLTATWHAGCGTVNTGFTGAPSNAYFRGDLDEVAVYTTELTATAIANRVAAVPQRQSWVDTVRTARPWGWWRLADTGTSLADASGNGNGATSSAGGVTRSQLGAIATDTAITFDGSTGCAVVGTSQANPTTFTLEAWFRTSSASGGAIVGFSDGTAADTTSTKQDRHVYLSPTGIVSFGVFGSGVRTAVSSSAGYNDGAWHHVVAAIGAGGMTLYLDGALAASDANTASENTTGRWHIGCQTVSASWANAPASAYLGATIDEVAVYPHVLDAAAVRAHYRAGLVPPSYAADVAASAPWLFWRLDEKEGHELVDASGNARRGWSSNGGVSRRAPGITPGGSAFRFDGATGCAVSTVAHVNPSVFSLEAWFRTTTTSGGPIIGGSTASTPDDTVSGDDRHLYMTNAGQVAFVPYDQNVPAYVAITSTASYNDGLWHHAVATLGSGGRALYVDGVLVASGGTVSTVNQNHYWKVACDDLSVSIPNRPSSTYFAGDVDEVAIYTTALSANAVASHHREGRAALTMPAARQQSGPWATWRLNESSGTALADETGNGNTATASASGTTANVAGVLAGDAARDLDGAAGCTVGTTSMVDPQTFAVEAWLRTTTTTGGPIVAYSTTSTATATGLYNDRIVYVLDDGRVTFTVWDGAAYRSATSTGTVNDGAWHHVVATIGAGGQKLFVDGSLAGSVANTASSVFAQAGYWHVGCNSFQTGFPSTPTSLFLDATIDEVSVFTVELDAATVAYRHALVERPLTTYASAVTARQPTFYWKLDETSGAPQDSSGAANHGTASASAITRRQAPAVTAGASWAFNGTAGCAVTAASSVNPTNYSQELWFRTTTTSGGGLVGFTDSSAATTAGTNYDRALYLNNSGNVVLGGTTAITVTSPSTYNDGMWHHVVGTVGANGTRLYVDGVLVASHANSSVNNFTGYWHIGCTKLTSWPTAPTSSYLAGSIDDAAVHPVQLSAETVRWHYLSGLVQRPALVDGTSRVARVVGTGTGSSTGDGGAATAATINAPYAVVTDVSGNVYVSEGSGCRVRKVSPNGIISTFAGTGTCSSTGDGGAATSATINGGHGLAVGPDGSVYVAEGGGHRVRKVSPSGTISTVAGTGTASSTGDGGAATSATINTPRGLVVDAAGSLYIAERAGHRVRKVSSSGTISTVIGTGTASSTGDGGAATSATINAPRGLAIGADGSLYVAEVGGCRVRRVVPAGTASTFAGTGTCTSTGDGGAATSATTDEPYGLAFDAAANLFVAELGGNRMRRIDANGTITTIMGNGTASSTGDGGAASAATFDDVGMIAVDEAGRLLLTETSPNLVRRLG